MHETGVGISESQFLRDLNQDYAELGRTYFPNLEISAFDYPSKRGIEKEITAEFEEARMGIRVLPSSSRFGVYLACRYYYMVLAKIQRIPPHSSRKQG
ncbi:hypothetical protein [Flavobacterium sp. AG291]|uniref:hypothetical protein n=1 Tax=Flavobacterium sp. AG291 TaxID=2184000 RepID=UPI000E2DCD76|nr:hypothetical protein [Flavobacterium sp. AG291]RDI11209.1 hypothetical protein DEU42_106143 [Flavobacterium sp. AG291]